MQIDKTRYGTKEFLTRFFAMTPFLVSGPFFISLYAVQKTERANIRVLFAQLLAPCSRSGLVRCA